MHRILVVDDNVNEVSTRTLMRLGTSIPGVEFKGYRFFDEIDLDDDFVVPHAVVLDCVGAHGGRENAFAGTLEMFDRFQAEQLPKAILILSADDTFVLRTKQRIEDLIQRRVKEGQTHLADIKVYAVDRSEIRLVKVLTSEQFIYRDLTRCPTNGLRTYLNETFETTFLLNPNDFVPLILQQDNITPGDIWGFHADGSISFEEAIRRMREHADRLWTSGLSPTVYTPGDFDFEKAIRFARFSGEATKGPAVFTVDEVESHFKQGHKPVLIVKDYDPAQVPQILGKIAGIILLKESDPAHMASLFGTHNITGLYACSSGYDIEEIENNVHQARFGNGSIIKSGDVVTIDTDINSLLPQDIQIKPSTADRNSYQWVSELYHVMQEKLRENGIGLPTLKKSIGSVNGFGHFIDTDFGLIRTEYLLAEDQRATAAFRQAVLKCDTTGRRKFEATQRAIFKRLFNETSLHVRNRVRLLDVVPEDVFSTSEQQEIEARFGTVNTRGIQLARKLPSMYRRQVRALFQAFKEAVDEGLTPLECEPIEIMIPLVRTGDDVLFAKHIIKKLSGEFGLSTGQYRFGCMVETLEAGQNIEPIVKVCDFVSIGSNDYTSEFFGCGRSDWAKRRQLTKDLGGLDPFITLEPRVAASLKDVMTRARTANPILKIDACGDHVMDPASLAQFASMGVDAVSLKPGYKNMDVLPLMAAYMLNDSLPAPQA